MKHRWREVLFSCLHIPTANYGVRGKEKACFFKSVPLVVRARVLAGKRAEFWIILLWYGRDIFAAITVSYFWKKNTHRFYVCWLDHILFSISFFSSLFVVGTETVLLILWRTYNCHCCHKLWWKLLREVMFFIPLYNAKSRNNTTVLFKSVIVIIVICIVY